MKTYQIIGANIRAFRMARQMPQRVLAKGLGIGKSRLSQIENGCCRRLTLARLEKIAGLLNTDAFTLAAKGPAPATPSTNGTPPLVTHPKAVQTILIEIARRLMG